MTYNTLPKLNPHPEPIIHPVQGEPITFYDVRDLSRYEDSPFQIYQGERRQKLLRSIEENGIMEPLIIWEEYPGLLRILSGTNRHSCAVELGMKTVPCILKKRITRAQAELILTQTNLNQRGFESMLISERAKALKMELDALKSERKSAEWTRRVEGSSLEEAEDISPEDEPQIPQPPSRDQVAANNGLSSAEVYRYIRLAELIPELLYLVDQNQLSIRAGVSLSFLPEALQKKLYEFCLKKPEAQIDISSANELKNLSRSGALSEETLDLILSRCVPASADGSTRGLPDSTAPSPERNPTRRAPKNRTPDLWPWLTPVFEKYCPGLSQAEMLNHILTALEQYFSSVDVEDEPENA